MKAKSVENTSPANTTTPSSSILKENLLSRERGRVCLKMYHRYSSPIAPSTASDTQTEVFSVRMNITIAKPISARNTPGRPSLYSTKSMPTYTSAEPVSFSARMISIGRPSTTATCQKSFHLPMEKP